MSWSQQFGNEYEVPNEVLSHPLMVDTSWGNDMCPSFRPSNQSEDGPVLWVEHPEARMREAMEKRFLVAYNEQDVLETDSLAEAIKCYESLVQPKV